MATIKGYFPPFDPHAYVLVAVKVEELGIDWTHVDMLIDTGADFTAIHSFDALSRLSLRRSDLSPAAWPPSQIDPLRGIGGGIRYRRVSASYRLECEDGSWLQLEGEIRLGELFDESDELPSLLGLDLLGRFRLTIDKPSGSVTLEQQLLE